MVDPLLAALAALAESAAVELAMGFAERQWKRGRSRDLTPERVARLAEGTANRLDDALRRDRSALPEQEWNAVLATAQDSLAAASPITVDDALDADLRAERLAAHVRARAVGTVRSAGLGERAGAAYDRVLVVTCAEILRVIAKRPDFVPRVHAATLQEMRGLARRLDAAGERDQEGAAAREFERRYLGQVERTLGGIELFGVNRGRTPRLMPFETAYVRLAVARSDGGRLDDEDDEYTGSGIEVTSAFGEHRRILLRGAAGAGKTTLLRWLAVGAARDAQEADPTRGWAPPPGVVPFFVPLREYARRGFPDPEALPESVASVIAAEMPAGWVSAQLGAGRAMLLVDALDELEPARRQEARTWLDHLVGAYPEVRFVVSARPFAVAEDWLEAVGFVTYDLLPLSPEGIEEFLAAWHRAAREQHASDPDMQEWLTICEERLRRQIETRVELRRLAGSPLLCGLLCALHQDNNMHLPRDRKGLYDAALDLLLVRWDEERGVRVEDLPWLSKEEQIVLLQRFAYSMVKNHEVAVSRDEAAQRFAHAMRGLRSREAEAEPVLQRTLERTGLLREPSPDEVRFVHRTFRDYLAAKEVVDSGDLRFLVEQAHLDQWYDVVVYAVAHARPQERDRVLRALLDGNDTARADRRVHHRLHLVAAACLEQADVLETDEVRQLVQEAAAGLIPPATLDDADLLARAGPFVLDLLPGPEGLSAQQAACVVRTMAMIGGEGVRERLAEFVPVAGALVVDELLRAWRRSRDPDGYARTVLADVDFGERSLEVRGGSWHRVTCLPHLRRLTSVVCSGDIKDLRPIAAVPQLRRLELLHNDLVDDLSPLTACRTLRVLQVSGCEFLQDLSPLGETTVEELSLSMTRVDLATLRPGRLRRLAVRDLRLRDGLDPLPAGLDLRELAVDNLPASRNLRGVARWPGLEHVSLRGGPRSGEVEELARLPRLAVLTVRRPVPDKDSLAALSAALPGVEIHVEGDSDG